MIVEALLGLTCASALGAGAAQIIGATACDWRARSGQMKTRLLVLKRGTAPGSLQRVAGAAFVAFILGGGTLAAYAAQPSLGAPERLPREAVGVVGSGDQLTLIVVENDKARKIKLGQDYLEGWRLAALTSSEATLVKDGASRRIGLNPTGAIAQTASSQGASVVAVVTSDPIQQAINAQAENKACRAEFVAKSPRPLPAITAEGDRDVMAQVMGQAWAEQCYRAGRINFQGELNPVTARAMAVARGDINAVRQIDRLPPIGPDQITQGAARTYTDEVFAPGTFSTAGYILGPGSGPIGDSMILFRTRELLRAANPGAR